MASIINIYMKDYANGGGGYNEGLVRLTLEEYFNAVCEHPDATAKRAYASWVRDTRCVHPQANDLIIHILPSHSESVIQRVAHQRVSPGYAGATFVVATGAISEVYVDEGSGTSEGLAKMIFHEFLHNKRQQGDALHTECGAGTRAIASAKHMGGGILQTQLTPCDKRLMAPFLGTSVKQYNEYVVVSGTHRTFRRC